MRWWRRKSREEDLERELRSDLELETEDLQAEGRTPEEAHRAAQRALGNITLIREETRAMWGWSSVESFGQDLRYAVRVLRKAPVFTAVAILSLALGIGANTAIFGLINGLLFKSLPVRDPESLLFIGKQEQGGRVSSYFYYETYDRLKAAQPFFQEFAAYAERVRMNVAVDGSSAPAMGQLVSGNYYSVLGVPPAAGRLFTAEDDRVPGGHPVAVISYPYWQSRFGSAPSAIGKKILIDGSRSRSWASHRRSFSGFKWATRPRSASPS